MDERKLKITSKRNGFKITSMADIFGPVSVRLID